MVLVANYTERTVADFVDLWAHKRLNLSPAFQRKSVWSTRDRRLMVESILRGIPVPSVFLYRQTGKSGKPVYDVIDGKQRLETLLLFMGKGPLALEGGQLSVRTSLDDADEVANWSWFDLPKATRATFQAATLPVVEVEGSLAEIIDLFVRINSTGQQLTGQERRHARYHTNPLLRRAEMTAESHRDWLAKHGVMTPAAISRMKHVELVTELLLSIHDQAPINKKKRIDQVIGGGALDEKAVVDASKRLGAALSVLDVILPDLKTTRFRQLADFYTVVLLLARLKDEGYAVSSHASARNELAGELLRRFGLGVDESSEAYKKMRGMPSGPFGDYLATVREGTDRADVRLRRERILRGVLDGVFEALDPNRTFNTTQRRIIWHSSHTKTCAVCRKPIARWEDFAADHVDPYIKGGATKLENAALTHKRCNSSKGAR